ncbi:hypothetical protein ES703_60715 [subsurface metagenome]
MSITHFKSHISAKAGVSGHKNSITVRITDISTLETLYVPLPACTVKKITSVLSGPITETDATITAYRNTTTLTDGVITIEVAGSAAGVIDSCEPTDENVFDGTEYLKLVAGGESTGVAPVLVTIEFDITPQ